MVAISGAGATGFGFEPPARTTSTGSGGSSSDNEALSVASDDFKETPIDRCGPDLYIELYERKVGKKAHINEIVASFFS